VLLYGTENVLLFAHLQLSAGARIDAGNEAIGRQHGFTPATRPDTRGKNHQRHDKKHTGKFVGAGWAHLPP